MNRVRWFDTLFVILFLYLFALQIQAIWPFTIDDMYISLRYARHWADGEGLLWNTHSAPVEGYSNFSFVALGALSLLLNINPVVTLKIAGIMGLFFTSVFIYGITRFWFNPRQSFIPVIGLLLYKGQIIWAVSGLETTVYQTFICGAVYCCFRGLGYVAFPGVREAPGTLFFLAAGLFLALAGLTRPETPAIMALFFILLCLDIPQYERTLYWRGMFLFVFVQLIIFLPYFLWRWQYYGLLFPNPVYCKGFKNTTLLDINYLKLVWPFALFATVACVKTQDKRCYFLALPSVLYLILLVGADPIVAFDNRLFLPAFALLLPVALLGVGHTLLNYLKERDQIFTACLYVVFFYLLFIFIPMSTLTNYRYFTHNPIKGELLRAQVVKWLATHTHTNDSVVLADAGFIPYQSDRRFIDSYCLNNPAMAQYPKAWMYEQFCHQILQEKPSVIILTSLTKEGQVIYTPSDQCLKSLLNDQKDYKLVASFFNGAQDSSYRYELFTNF